MEMKYIIFEGYMPVIFSKAIGHDKVANSIPYTPTAAGFVQLYVGEDDGGNACIKAVCSGASVSLALTSLPMKDSQKIEEFLNAG